MTTGTKSLLFGVHQFFWHPITVARGWRRLYGKWPRGWDWIAILVHDWGYWGCEKMDDEKGERHPIFGAQLIAKISIKWSRLFGESQVKRVCRAIDLFELVRYHSRYLSAKEREQPSQLCWADKMSPAFDPPWFYIFRARLSGELKEYREAAANGGRVFDSDAQWYDWLRKKCEKDAIEKRPAIPRH